MPYQFTISPDFNASQLAPWFIFNNHLQKTIADACHLEIYDDFQNLHTALQSDKVDIIFANAFDVAYLVREKGFIPLASGQGRSDETLVGVSAGSPVQTIRDFKRGVVVAATEAPDVEMIGRILLEPADLAGDAISIHRAGNYITVAKALINNQADAGFFLKRSYDELSDLVRKQIRPIVCSHIYVVQHALLLSPKLADKHASLLQSLLKMAHDPSGKALLEELGMPGGWQPMGQEDAELMIDMMDTLLP